MTLSVSWAYLKLSILTFLFLISLKERRWLLCWRWVWVELMGGVSGHMITAGVRNVSRCWYEQIWSAKGEKVMFVCVVGVVICVHICAAQVVDWNKEITDTSWCLVTGGCVVSIYWPGKYKNNLPSFLHFQSKENDLISILEEEAGLKWWCLAIATHCLLTLYYNINRLITNLWWQCVMCVWCGDGCCLLLAMLWSLIHWCVCVHVCCTISIITGSSLENGNWLMFSNCRDRLIWRWGVVNVEVGQGWG